MCGRKGRDDIVKYKNDKVYARALKVKRTFSIPSIFTINISTGAFIFNWWKFTVLRLSCHIESKPETDTGTKWQINFAETKHVETGESLVFTDIYNRQLFQQQFFVLS